MSKIYIRKEMRVREVEPDKWEKYLGVVEYTELEYKELFNELKDERIEELKEEIEYIKEQIKEADRYEKEDLRYDRDELKDELKAVKGYKFSNEYDLYDLDKDLQKIEER